MKMQAPRYKPLEQEFQGMEREQNRRVLDYLLQHPFQRVKDLSLALAMPLASIDRHLQAAINKGYVEWVTPSLTIRDTCRLYYLSRLGIQALATALHADVSSLASAYQAHERGMLRMLPRLPSLVTLQEVLAGFVREAPDLFAYSNGERASITWKWLLDYKEHFTYHGRRERCCADALVVFARHGGQKGERSANGSAHPDGYYAAWLLVDAGLDGKDDLRLIRSRLEALVHYRESAERRASYSLFPPILVIVKTERQRFIWQRCAAQVTTEAPRQYAPLLGAVIEEVNIKTSEPAGRWKWYSLTSKPASHLKYLFSHMPEDALPSGFTASHVDKDQRGKMVALPQGNYTARSQRISPQVRNEQGERECVALLGLALSRRHLEILQDLYAHPLLSTAELAAFEDIEITSVRRYLYDLERYLCVGKRGTVCGPRWELRDRGLRLIAATLGVALTHVAMIDTTPERRGQLIQRGQQFLQSEAVIRHAAAIYDFFARLHVDAHAYGKQHQVVWWESGTRCERRHRDHQWVWHNFRPDGDFEYCIEKRTVRAWVEIDLGTMDAIHLRSKLEAYAYYIRSREFVREGLTALPFLLIIVPDKAQFQRVARIVRESLSNTGLVVRIATSTRIATFGPLERIWLEVLPEHPGVPFLRRSLLDGERSESTSSK
jgi:DNA-binding MarR family transcriptional regulator